MMNLWGWQLFSSEEWNNHNRVDLICQEQKAKLSEENSLLHNSNWSLSSELNGEIVRREQAEESVISLQKSLSEVSLALNLCKKNEAKPDLLEQKVFSKYPKQTISYGSRYVFEHPEYRPRFDIRYFLKEWDDVAIPTVGGASINEVVDNARLMVRTNIRYIADSSFYSVPDFIQFAQETAILGHGDCEDHAVYLGCVILKSWKRAFDEGKIPVFPWYRLRLTMGNVKQYGQLDGHSWISLLRESVNGANDDGGWVVPDTTYRPEYFSTPIAQLLLQKDDSVYNPTPTPYGSVWFSTDVNFSYAQNDFRDKVGPENTQRYNIA
jgi:hypothetical protein